MNNTMSDKEDYISDEDKSLSEKEVQEKYFPNTPEMSEESSE